MRTLGRVIPAPEIFLLKIFFHEKPDSVMASLSFIFQKLKH